MDNVLKLIFMFKKVNKNFFLKTDNLLKLVFMLNKVNNFFKTILYSCLKKLIKKLTKKIYFFLKRFI